MSRISDLDTPQPLPRPKTAEGKPRRVGVEIEFSGLTEAQVARILAKEFGGSTREERRGHWAVSGGGMQTLLTFVLLKKIASHKKMSCISTSIISLPKGAALQGFLD